MDKKKTIAIVAAAVVMLGAAAAAIWFVLIRPQAGDAADPPAVSGTVDGQPDAGLEGAPGASGQAQDGMAGGSLDGRQDVPGGADGAVDEQPSGQPAEPIDLGAPGGSDDDGDSGNPFGIDPDVGVLDGPPSTDDAGVPDGGEDGDDAGGEEPGSGVGSQSGGYEAGGVTTGSGVAAPSVEDTDGTPSDTGTDGERPAGDTGTQPPDANDGGSQPEDASTGGQDASRQGSSHVKVDGVPVTFSKAVYSRDKTRCLVKVALPSGKAIDDPSKYTVVANVDERGHKPSRGIIYSCPSRAELVVYMSSSGFFAEKAAFAIVPTGSSGTLDVTPDCYVELPYGETYQGSSILDGSSAAFRDMMRLMFDDSGAVDEWVNGRKSSRVDSIGLLGDKVDGSSQLQLGGTSSGTSGGTSSGTSGGTSSGTSGNQSGTQLTGAGGGTSAATPPKDVTVSDSPAKERRGSWVTGKFLYSKSSSEKVYHDHECLDAKAIYEMDEKWFSSEEEAADAGYSRCKLCWR